MRHVRFSQLNMDEQTLLKVICRKEIVAGCYNVAINDVPLYSLIRYHVRVTYLKQLGFPQMESTLPYNKWTVFRAGCVSIYQLIKLLLSRKTISNVFFPWPRVDKINGVYLEKFSDTLIETSKLTDYAIFLHGAGGVHPTPRLHQEKIVYIEAIKIISDIIVLFCGSFFKRKYSDQIRNLRKSVYEAYGQLDKWNELEKQCVCFYISSLLLKVILKRIRPHNVIGIPRSSMIPATIAARKLNIKVIELQHGITYGETNLYSGYRVPMLEPDFFLAFGDNHPLDVYGISESKIFNIGWPMTDYLEHVPKKHEYGEDDVLVVSEPEVSEMMCKLTLKLAKDNPKIHFYFRPHPAEVLSCGQIEKIKSQSNITIQDKTESISVVLHQFTNIIGENSTVLYEGLSMGKKVGRVFFDGLKPIFLDEEDPSYFWLIHNQDDFLRYLKEDLSSKPSKSIYSPFDKSKFLKILNN